MIDDAKLRRAARLGWMCLYHAGQISCYALSNSFIKFLLYTYVVIKCGQKNPFGDLTAQVWNTVHVWLWCWYFLVSGAGRCISSPHQHICILAQPRWLLKDFPKSAWNCNSLLEFMAESSGCFHDAALMLNQFYSENSGNVVEEAEAFSSVFI